MPTRRLSELSPEFGDIKHPGGTCRALSFDCPACGGHELVVPFSGVSFFENGAMWRLHSAEDVATATLAPSIHVQSGCGFHGFVTAGEVAW